MGTAKRRGKDCGPFKILYRGAAILETTTYKYLGMEIDCTLNLNSHFDKCFKRASGRLRLLALPKARAAFQLSVFTRTCTNVKVLTLLSSLYLTNKIIKAY